MNKKIISIAIAALMAVGVAGCAEDASKVDLKEPQQKGKSLPDNYEVRVPQSLTVFQNIDAHPTIAKLCVDGVAFATTSRDYNAIMRVPEWDKDCKR